MGIIVNKYGNILKSDNHGRIQLSVGSQRKNYRVAEVILMSLFPDVKRTKTIVYEDTNILNNNVLNLRWGTPDKSRSTLETNYRGNTIALVNSDGKILQRYVSVADAARILEISSTSIYNSLSKGCVVSGYIFTKI